MRDRLFRFRRWAVAALTGATVLGGVSLVGVGSASAAVTGSSAGAAAPTTVSAGVNSQAASNWFVQAPNGFVAGDVLTFQVLDPTHTNCTVANENIGFASTPTVTVLAVKNATFTGAGAATDTAPSITPSLSTATGEANCTAQSVKDVLTLTYNNTATGTSTDVYELQISGLTYNVGSAMVPGNVHVTFAGNGTAITSNNSTSGNSTAASFGVAPLNGNLANATITNVAVTANNPAVAVAPGATNAAVSNVVVAESVAGAVLTGYVCVTLPAGDKWDNTTTPTITASGGGAAAANPGIITVTNTQDTAIFNVTTASTTAPATYTLSGLAVDDTAGSGPVTVAVSDHGSATCTGTTSLATALRAFYVATGNRLFGAIADATAAAELENEYVPGTNCPDTATAAGSSTAGKTRAVVVATDANWPDALAASYLAGKLFTGLLLTPTNSVSSDALTAMRLEGITNVFVVGGPQAVSQADITQLQGTQAYSCGGSTPLVNGQGNPQNLVVQVVAGNTQDDTAQQIAQYFGGAGVGTADFHTAYGTTDAFNDTAGNFTTTAPAAGALKTAIVATDGGFQDAMSAGGLAWSAHFPVLLTPTASLGTQANNALINLGIQQVIVMGGPAAVSNAVVTAIQAMNIPVLRIAGTDLTDTSQFMAQFVNGDVGGQDWDATALYVSRGDFYADGLAGSVVSGFNKKPLVLTLDPNTVTSALGKFLNGAGLANSGIDQTEDGPVVTVTALGGTQAITAATLTTTLSDLSAG
ncbi:MAG: cell wall-binding repeat-containing protein [Acidimicrobiales bacterium]